MYQYEFSIVEYPDQWQAKAGDKPCYEEYGIGFVRDNSIEAGVYSAYTYLVYTNEIGCVHYYKNSIEDRVSNDITDHGYLLP